MAQNLIPAAVITGAHGLKGHLRAKCLLADATLLRGTLPTDNPDLALTLLKVQPQPGNLVLLHVAESTSRTAAESLRGLTLFLPRSSLPATRAEEVYLHDLLGRDVHLPSGASLGTVAALKNTGSPQAKNTLGTDLLEITTPAGALHLIPAHADFFDDLTAAPLTLTDLGQQLTEL